MKNYTHYIPYIIFLVSVLGFCTLIFIAPYSAHLGEDNQGFSKISDIAYYFFHPVCHQSPERSFFIYDHKLGVCARCTGIYLGILILTILYPIFRSADDISTPSKYYLIACIIPMAIDGGTQITGLRESFNELRFATGFIFGGTLTFYLVPVFNQLSKIIYRKLCDNLYRN